MQGNAPVYDAQVLDEFKKAHESKDSKKEKTNKVDALIKEKDARIDALSSEIELLKDQLNIKDNQIQTLTEVTKQAQALNLTDKDPERVKLLQGNNDKDSDASDARTSAYRQVHEEEPEANKKLQNENEKLKKKLDEVQHRGFWKRLFNKDQNVKKAVIDDSFFSLFEELIKFVQDALEFM